MTLTASSVADCADRLSLLQRHIDDLEAQAAVSLRVAKLTTDPDRRAHNTRLSHELRLLAKQLRSSARDRAATPERPLLTL